ncbi:phosphoesterase RecJ-like protein [Halanaerobium saccharolyticum]|uniref:Phosphoesterase RecJ-like protein n=1 Tax=Halanaerobium saccharolyticum TaxID=43595 RepID=A0A4R7Z6K8_9FIRM|nr:bifunctional oligoribonuclease/PAP phosphatase NrnA [Halanaerobium saccharolyticum]RAK11132.1 phosphoesterase RecJ-like protein [Halanaerobium saccharolyticum]TDW06983.1 phosphoesterase RecJ-like protein [Halanaerobium saccharolyticum]TDX63748.1 phosphoesterase RecJ-like protein [Halanaerobium saccharolyticum]
MQKKIKEIIKILYENDNFLIVGHVGADGDSIGSVTALTRLLKKKNKKVRAYLNRDTLAPFSFLKVKGEEFYTDAEKLKEDLKTEDYILITLDSGTRERVDLDEEIINSAQFIINIDHHADNTHFGKINLVQADRAAVGEIIYNFAVEMIDKKLPLAVAEPLGTAIITDTGALRYENTTSRVLRILADLMDFGVNIYKINKKVFGSLSYQALILKGMALSTLEKSENGKIAWLYVSRQMMHEAETDYTEGLVGLARDIEDVEIGILFTEEEEKEIKVSLRSNFYAEVNKLAAEFNGGGHPRASGATVEKTLQEAINSVVEAAKKYV